MGDACKSGDDTPDEAEGGKPKSWGSEFEYDIAWDLEQNKADDVDGQCREKLLSSLLFRTVRDKLNTQQSGTYSCAGLQ